MNVFVLSYETLMNDHRLWERLAERARRVSHLEVELATVAMVMESTLPGVHPGSLESTQVALEWMEQRLESSGGT